MIVSIPDNIYLQKRERKLFLKKTYGEALNFKIEAKIARERLLELFVSLNPALRFCKLLFLNEHS